MGIFDGLFEAMAAADRVRKRKDIVEVKQTAVRTLKQRGHTDSEISEALGISHDEVLELLWCK